LLRGPKKTATYSVYFSILKLFEGFLPSHEKSVANMILVGFYFLSGIDKITWDEWNMFGALNPPEKHPSVARK